MAYTALYRKLRPNNFSDIIGQSHVVRTLQNQILNSRISHAYLFCGTRGTGKTSTSLVFSKAINCLDLQNGEPCNKCESCMSILENRNLDIIEIDAASNNGVDNIRSIREEISYAPTIGNYKIYIIDEVHMLSTGAFNALLKTLEEPPSHVIFILATTDPQKLPATILSRCQRYDFKRISVEDMTNSILEYVDTEEYNISREAIEYIAAVSDGAMRDALSILDQAFAFYYEEEINLDKVLALVGSVDKDIFFQLADGIINFDTSTCINIIDNVINLGRDISQFTSDLVKHFRDLLVSKEIKESSNALNFGKAYIDKLKKQSETCETAHIIKCINVFSKLQLDLKLSNNQRVTLEAACVKLCNADKENDIEGLLIRLDKLEKQLEKGIPTVVTQNMEFVDNKEIKEEKPQIIVKKAIPEDIKNIKDRWSEVISKISSISDRAMLKIIKPGYIDGEILYLVSDTNTDFYLKRKVLLEDVLEKHYGIKVKMEFITKNDYNNLHQNKYGVKDVEVQSNKVNEILDKFSDYDIDVVNDDF